MSAPTRRGRGRPKREYRIRVRGERREMPDYDKLARALLEHAAMQEREGRDREASSTTDPAVVPTGDEDEGGAS